MRERYEEVNHNVCETMTREEFMDERRELGLDIDPQANEDDDCCEYGYSSNDTFNFILECDREIFEDFLSWASIFINGETEGERHIYQIFSENLGLNPYYPISVNEIFNIWLYKSKRVVYWICDNEEDYDNIEQQQLKNSKFDISDTSLPIITLPFFVYRTSYIVAEVFFISSPCDDEDYCLHQRSVWCYEKVTS